MWHEISVRMMISGDKEDQRAGKGVAEVHLENLGVACFYSREL